MSRLEKVSTSLRAFVCLYESLSRAVGVGIAWIKINVKSTVLSWWPGDFRPIWHTTNRSHHLWHMHLHTCWRWHTCTQHWRWRWLLLSSTKIRVWEGSSTCQMTQYSKRDNTSHILIIKDEQALGQLEEDLANILGNANESVPQEAGIHVIKESPKNIKKRKTARSSQGNPPQKKRKILDVKTTKYGRKKCPVTNRVGQHAETIRKMYRVHVSIPANRSDAAAAVVTASSKTKPGAPARADTSKPKMHGGDVPKVPAVPASSQNAKQP